MSESAGGPVHGAGRRVDGGRDERERGYSVRVFYSEPGFHLRNPHLPAVYSCDFDFPLARSEEEALGLAMREWNLCASGSRVAWGRVLERVSIRRRGRFS
jgi:hypothetical protein